MPTRAINYLEKQRVSFEVVRYEHAEKGVEFAARATGFPLEGTVKTLVADVDRNGPVLAMLPGDRRLDLKLLAHAFSAKRAVMADVDTAERVTGYTVGGISPFGTRRKLSAVLETFITEQPEILINAGQRGVMLKMRPEDIVRVLNCRLAVISR